MGRKLWVGVVLISSFSLVAEERGGSASAQEVHRWTDETGLHSIEAALIEQNEHSVVLQKKDGSWIRVPIERLSQADREYLLQLRQPKAEDGGRGPNGKSLDRQELLRKVEPAVVVVETDTGQGSGFFVAQDLVVTNFHVIEGAKVATVRRNQQRYPVLGFLGGAPEKDLVLLRVDCREQRASLVIANQLPQKLDEVYTFGSPLGLENSVSRGEVSAIRTWKEICQQLPDLAVLRYDDDVIFIQTTAPISPGNSGGPLVNGSGEVVGVNTWREPLGQNLNFAVSNKTLRDFVEDSKNKPLQKLAALTPSLPAQPPPLHTIRSGGFEIQLPTGEIVSAKSFVISEKELEERYFGPIKKPGTNLEAFGTYVPDIGHVVAGILYNRTGPTLFGYPSTYAFVYQENRVIRQETIGGVIEEEIISDTILGKAYAKAYTIFEFSRPQVESEPVVWGILGYEKGKLNGLVNLWIDDMGVDYYGVWENGEPSVKDPEKTRQSQYPLGMCVIYEIGHGKWNLLKRQKGGNVQLFLIENGQIVRSFDSFDKAMADPEGNAKMHTFEETEKIVKSWGEEIATTLQKKAKDRQAKVIAQMSIDAREEINARIKKRWAENAAAVGRAFREAARRAGW